MTFTRQSIRKYISRTSYSKFFFSVDFTCLEGFLLNSDYEDAQYILDGFYNGFSLGILAGETNSAKRNCVSAYVRPDIIENYLADELEAGAIAGPFLEPPFTGTHINRFGVIPKSTPGKWRLITDLSFPKGKSVNDRIPDCN